MNRVASEFLTVMARYWQVMVMTAVLAISSVRAADAALDWKPVEPARNGFSQELAMLDQEREEYANHLAGHAVAILRKDRNRIETARHLMTLALNLSPRNKRAVVANFQLAKDILPEAVPGELAAASLSRLLLTRGRLLAAQDGRENKNLARWFIETAAELDPKNEEAVYLREMERLDHGPVDWKILTDPSATTD
ncbi:MAG: hypothetical protein V4733_06515 [Verrucomicrobiota bacterium]